MNCSHDWRMYDSGFSQRYEYCYNCDVKKSDWDRLEQTPLELAHAQAWWCGDADERAKTLQETASALQGGDHDWSLWSDLCIKCGVSGRELRASRKPCPVARLTNNSLLTPEQWKQIEFCFNR